MMNDPFCALLMLFDANAKTLPTDTTAEKNPSLEEQ
jgi:hypothetical protein